MIFRVEGSTHRNALDALSKIKVEGAAFVSAVKALRSLGLPCEDVDNGIHKGTS
jgi:type III secretory pathway lipoprotein EscJ